MTQHFHAVVWIDHGEAKIFGFGEGGVDASRILAPAQSGSIHHKAGSGSHATASISYLRAVANALSGYREILVVGPAQTKTEFEKFLQSHAPEITSRVLGVLPFDQATDGEIVAFARKFFQSKDLSTPQR